MGRATTPLTPPEPDPGLCGSCLHSRRIVSGRGSAFRLCGLASIDSRFPKYPRLPVFRCSGFTSKGTAASP